MQMPFAGQNDDARIGAKGNMPRLAAIAAVVAVAVSLASVIFLGINARKEIDALALANSDRTEWSLGQLEVDLHKLHIAIHEIDGTDTQTLSQARRRFDIFYSRVQTLANSRQYSDIRETPEAAQALRTMLSFLEDYVPVFDGGDAQLVASVPALEQRLLEVSAKAREFSVSSVGWFASAADERRAKVTSLLSELALLTFTLVIILAVAAFVLFLMLRNSARSEQRAAEARNRLQEVVSTSIDAILAINLEGRIIEYNGAAERIFGYTRDEAIGEKLGDLIVPAEMRDAHAAGMRRYLDTGVRKIVGSGLIKLHALHKNGTVFPVEFNVSSAMADGKEIFVSYLRDISDRVAAETAIIEARDKAVAGEKKKAELLAVMSHEMRTPLNGLIGTLELCQDTDLNSSQKKYLAAMETSAKLLLHHVNAVLNISKAESGQLDLKSEEIDPRALLRELVESQRRSIEANQNRIYLSVEAGPKRIWTDPLRLRQVILNLVGNANKFTRNGDITVECDRLSDGKMVEFRVIDSGIGIREEDHERIFEDFRTLDASYGRRTEGTGLGLGIARRLVHAMGGSIGVESEFGEGSLFWVRLPIGEAAEGSRAIEQTPERNDKREDSKALKILLVEDNEINRLVARDMLRKAGHEVFEAHDGREGVKMAEIRPYDMILMDISMPEMDGITATKVIRSEAGPNQNAPIIALTAHALSEDIERFKAAGINDALIKPLSMQSLRKMLSANSAQPVAARPVEVAMKTDVLDDLIDQLGPDRTKGIVATFIGEAENTLRTLEDNRHAVDARKEHAGIVHKLAGSALVLGATHLGNKLRSLEDVLRSDQTVDMDGEIASLNDTWSATRNDLESWQRERF